MILVDKKKMSKLGVRRGLEANRCDAVFLIEVMVGDTKLVSVMTKEWM
jgi:hypothetical protein